jgi:HlyD family secretion protein
MTVRDGRTRRQAVRIGLRGTTHLEIAQGLEPGELVVSPAQAVTDGVRVRVAEPP